jgi:hypothetical protein
MVASGAFRLRCRDPHRKKMNEVRGGHGKEIDKEEQER